MTQERALDEKKANVRKPDATKAPDKRHTGGAAERPGLIRLQQQVGNRAVQRLLAQRAGDGSFELDDVTAGRINRARGGGQPLEGALQERMGESMGHDFSGVQVHTGSESDALNQQLSAKAFTTGQDIFFRQGAYDPGSTGGQELIAHELSHVVQQTTGRVSGGGGGMTVRPAGDAFEQEADAAAQAAAGTSLQVQRQVEEEEELQMQAEEEEEPIQMQAEEEEELQMQPLQRQEEEEELQMQAEEEEEEEEEPIQAKAVQRQEEEELQMQAEEEEEPIQAKAV